MAALLSIILFRKLRIIIYFRSTVINVIVISLGSCSGMQLVRPQGACIIIPYLHGRWDLTDGWQT